MPRTLAICLLCAIWSPAVFAAPKPLTKEEQKRIDDSIDRAIAFLKKAQTETGGWTACMYREGRFEAAQCALAAYALLEAGVRADDPVIRKAAEYVRPRMRVSDYTYEIALALLFFDRLGDPRDDKLMHTLAARLLAGQHDTGGWSYRCPLCKDRIEADLLTALSQLEERMKTQGPTREQALQGMAVLPTLKVFPAFRFAADLPWQEPPVTRKSILDSAERASLDGRTDNSNTQFALLGLWAARRHGIPVAPTFEMMVARFERSHAHPSGLWWYCIDEDGGTRSMTCVGLMALAVGRALSLATPGSVAPDQKDVHVLNGLAALSRHVGKPVYRMDHFVPFVDVYYLWSLERVGVLFDLPAIGDKDWYRWGAEALVTNQSKDGSWSGVAPHAEWPGRKNYDYRPTLTTAFALLFLKRSHPLREVTPKLTFKGAELNESLVRFRPDDKYPVRVIPASSPSRDRER